MTRPYRRLAVGFAILLWSGCAGRAPFDPKAPATGIRQRTGAEARLEGGVSATIPAGVRFDDGLTSDEAVAVALWNNAAFQISVSDLGFARADLLEAGVLTNPVLSLLFPVGPKQFEGTLRWPIEVLWERPRRVAAARLALDAAAERLVQAGLDLVASVRLAYVDLGLAIDREQVAKEAAALLARIDTLTQSRLSAGDISALEAATARIDAARGAQDAQRARARRDDRARSGCCCCWDSPPICRRLRSCRRRPAIAVRAARWTSCAKRWPRGPTCAPRRSASKRPPRDSDGSGRESWR